VSGRQVTGSRAWRTAHTRVAVRRRRGEGGAPDTCGGPVWQRSAARVLRAVRRHCLAALLPRLSTPRALAPGAAASRRAATPGMCRQPRSRCRVARAAPARPRCRRMARPAAATERCPAVWLGGHSRNPANVQLCFSRSEHSLTPHEGRPSLASPCRLPPGGPRSDHTPHRRPAPHRHSACE